MEFERLTGAETAAILLLSLAMWMLILDRYLFFWRDRPNLVAEIIQHWQVGRTRDPLGNQRLRDGLTSAFRRRSRRET